MATLSGFASTILVAYDVDEVLQDLTERVSIVLGLAGSGVSLAQDDRITYVIAAPERLAPLEQTQVREQVGPCVQAYRTRTIVAVPDLSVVAQEWGTYCTTAARIGIRAVAGIPMGLKDHTVGALNLYSDSTRDWRADDLAAAQVLADMATVYLINASQLRQHQQLNEQLQQALDSRVVIEQAKGLTAATYGISVEAAFELMRRTARHRSVSLSSLAETIMRSGLTI